MVNHSIYLGDLCSKSSDTHQVDEIQIDTFFQIGYISKFEALHSEVWHIVLQIKRHFTVH